MDPISFTASIIAILQLTSTVVGYLNDVKDAPKDRARCATEASNLFNLLNNLMYRLEEADNNRPWYTAVRALAIEDGPFDQYKLALEQLQPKSSSGNGITKIGNALFWKFSKQEINIILSRIERLKTLVQIALEMDHFKLSQAIKTCVDSLNNDNQAIKDDTSALRRAIPTLETGVNAVQQEQKRQRHRIILDWISSIDFAAQQSDIISRRQQGTGVWFTDSPEFLSWLQGSNQTLFCPGIPGAGKTMIAAIVVDHLWKHIQNQDIGVAYIYCNYKTQADQTVTSLAAIILKQLIQERPSIAKPVASLYDRHADRRTRPSLEEILTALQAVVSDYSKVYMIVDALDECLDYDGSRSQLLATLSSLQSKGNLSLLATSRSIPEVVQKFSLSPILEVRASDSDVKHFVAGQMHRLPRCVQRDNKLQETIQDKVIMAVDDSLLDKSTKSKILSTLDGLPKGSKALDEAYNDAIERIEGQLPGHRTLARNVLSWITYAQRPLTTGELCHALAVERGQLELDPDNVPDIEDVVSVCAGLIVIDDESNIIRLVHYTTQKYFEHIRESWCPQAQQEIASACLTYLSSKTFTSGASSNDEDFEIRIAKNVFFEYAATNWAQHVFTIQKEVSQWALLFLQDEALLASTSQMISIPKYSYQGYSQIFPKQTIGLHLTARYGLLFLLEELLRIVSTKFAIKANSPDGYSRTPLSYAAEGGHGRVVKLLVERDDVDADCKDKNGRTPLWHAVWRGHEAVVKLLVERDDVDADYKDNDGRTPLSNAVHRGHEAVVKLLVERDDVDIDCKDNNGRTPLLYAAEWGHEAVVKLLVERDDVDADSKDNNSRTPLSWAALIGHEAVVKLLVERDDVDADFKDNDGQTPLSCAAWGDHEAVVKLLVERDDVDADSKDNNSRTPLSYTAEWGHEAVVKLLVERDDVDADYKDDDGRTPLLYAVHRGHDAVVKLLVERDDVDADFKDNSGQTPLSYAAEGGHEAVVKLLVERDDVDADSKDNSDRTPLLYAAWRGHEAAVKLLVERDDVDADSKDNNSRTPLSYTAEWGHEAVVKLLVERDDVDADFKDNSGQTPLSYAAEGGHKAIVELLRSKLS